MTSSVGSRKGPWRLGEVARVVGLSRQTLHHYAALGLIRPVATTPGGHRLFGGSVFRRVEEIQAGKRTRPLAELARPSSPAPRGRKHR